MIAVPCYFFLALFALICVECVIACAAAAYRGKSQNWRTLAAHWEAVPVPVAVPVSAPVSVAVPVPVPVAVPVSAPVAVRRPGLALASFNTAAVWG